MTPASRPCAHPLALAHLTVLELSPPEVVETAAAAGFGLVGLRLAPAVPGQHVFPMLSTAAGRAPMMGETLVRMADLGVQVHDVELVALEEDSDVAAFEPLFEAAARLGARRVLVAGNGADASRMAERLAALSELAQPHGLALGLEFMPWRGIANLGAALRVVRSAGDFAGCGVIVDAIHLDRSGACAADLAQLRAGDWSYFQICDAPARKPAMQDELLFQAREARMVPGEGGLDLRGMLRQLPDGTTVSIEAPLRHRPPPLERARRLREATETLLHEVGRRPLRDLPGDRRAA
ncbi:TIM barrel protein [Ramlibacter tataouinensis]|uniref:sugar phosphate isomerase/epimerase family protein n=1 Tax=Ramlibacter tataouinensis TaxID=94132 RepID=UPI0022F38483|nr:TIM barrel protein [Ramlibacter tataouinensis]WBY02956.1 TIM barrel protein [Ramlibacter tataouinensis]